MPLLLLELFSEEIPARMQRTAMEALKAAFAKALQEARLEHGAIRGFVTPRRLAVRIDGVPDRQPDISIEKKGPRTSAPQAALDGFLKSSGLAPGQLEKRMLGKDEVYFATVHQKGQATKAVLAPIIEKILAEFSWPKSMRWSAHPMSWVRPLHNILCLFGEEVIPVRHGHLAANNITYGHRFLSPQKITLTQPADYEEALEKAHVIACPDKRKAKIESAADALAQSKGLTVRKDAGLLEEVTGLVEWPTLLMGRIDAAFMDLPPEVLTSEMRAHQKYFALLPNPSSRGLTAGSGAVNTSGDPAVKPRDDESISPHFLITSNMVTNDGGKAVIAGNERVLRARLSDGRFFWDQDRKVKLDDWAKKLDGVTFHAKIGTIAQKVERITKLAVTIAGKIGADAKKVERAARLCKADLMTGMVGEFPELQGVMGRYYALQQKESPEVADAIRDHYLPLGPDSPVPTEKAAACVALADKLDTLVTMFAIGEKPTGSKDQFALRRATLGILRILIENQFRLSVNKSISIILDHLRDINYLYDNENVLTSDELASLRKNVRETGKRIVAFEENEEKKHLIKVYEKDTQQNIHIFFLDRLRVQLKDQGIRDDIIKAVLEGTDDDDLVRLVARVKALEAFLKTPEGGNLLAAAKRAQNIVLAEAKKDKKEAKDYAGDVDANLLKEPQEKTLYEQLHAAKPGLDKALKEENFAAAMGAIATLRPAIDAFFDKVLVNDADPAIRTNRLRLLTGIDVTLSKIADFSRIEG